MGMVTVRSGSSDRVTVTVTSFSLVSVVCQRRRTPPRCRSPHPNSTETDGTSSSVMETVVSLVVPSVTPVGRVSVPKVSLTDSPSSSTCQQVAVKVKVFSVSPELKVTLAGTPE